MTEDVFGQFLVFGGALAVAFVRPNLVLSHGLDSYSFFTCGWYVAPHLSTRRGRCGIYNLYIACVEDEPREPTPFSLHLEKSSPCKTQDVVLVLG